MGGTLSRFNSRFAPVLCLIALSLPSARADSALPAKVPPYGIVLFDYLGSEPLTDSAHYPVEYPAIESEGNPAAPAVCWPHTSGARQVRFVFQNPTNIAHDAQLTVQNGLFIDGHFVFIQLSLLANPTTLHFPASGTAEATITITGLPNYVTKGILGFDLSLVSDYTSLSGGQGELIYLTDAAPQGIQSPVWTDVLEDACLWAYGQAGSSGCCLTTTQGLFGSFVFHYHPTTKGAFYTTTPLIPQSDEDDSYYCIYKLKKLFHDRSVSQPDVHGDCRDVSNYLYITWQALGIGGTCTQNRTDLWDSQGVPFETNAICGTGSDPLSQGNYHSFVFAYHQVVLGINVFDASCAQWVDPSGQPYHNAPANWPLEGYWQTSRPQPPPGESAFFGLVWRYGGSNSAAGEIVGRASRMSYLTGYSSSLN